MGIPMRSTDQWQQLLTGITDGPWVPATSPKKRYGVIADDSGQPLTVAFHKGAKAFHDSNLMAAAPEAVAEVVRLRRELAAMETYYLELARSESQDGRTRDAQIHNEHAHRITRVLNQGEK